MPGMVGFIPGNLPEREAKHTLRRMRQSIVHQDYYEEDDLFIDGHICATRAHQNIVQKNPQPFYKSGFYIWLDGEFYNQNELNNQLDNVANTDLELLIELYKYFDDFSFLKLIDGFFSAVIYDSVQQKIHLISDRYGLRHLYWSVINGDLAWSSEIKAFLALPKFEPKIDPLAVEEFFCIGQLLENRTWFKGVVLLPSAGVLTWDLNEHSYDINSYWGWNEISPLPGNINKDETVEELGRIFVDSIERRCYPGDRIGVLLSGGLDSRSILAALPKYVNPIHAITFGKAGCDEISIAKVAAKKKGAHHHVVQINSENWLFPRLQGVWWTDGHLNLIHMHGIEAIQSTQRNYTISMHSFAGDLILGGSYLSSTFLNTQPSTVVSEIYQKIRLNNRLFEQDSIYGHILEIINKYTFVDAFYLQNRVRRFTINGPKILEATLGFDRKPTYDNELIEFCYSLPDKLRYKSRVYKKMLLFNFPDYYRDIPWQKTGVPISWPDIAQMVSPFLRKATNKFLLEMNRFGANYVDQRSTTDYPNWIRQEPARSFFEKVLINSAALYTEYISKQQVHQDWERHLNGENHADSLCLYLTFEIWLQQVFAGNYRPDDG